MAGLYACCHTFFSAGKDKLAKETPTDGSNTAPVSCTPISAPAPTLDLPGRYKNKDLQKTTKQAQELFV